MQIAVFLQYYHTPDCPTGARPYALVERLGRDHDVTVVTTRSWRKKRITNRFSWAPPGVRLVEFDVPYDNKMSSPQRLKAFLHYAARAAIEGFRMPEPDLVIGSSPPLTVAATSALVANLRGVPWLFEVQDLWPDFPIQMGVLDQPGIRHGLYGLESMLYRTAQQVVTPSPDMTKHVRTVAPSTDSTTIEYGSSLQLVSDISEEQQTRLRRRFSLDDRSLVLYAGAFGRANAIPTLIDAANQFAQDSDVLFAFAGHGYHEPTVQQAAQKHEHIRHVPPLSYPDALTLFSIADVSLVSFLDRPVLAANAPGKFYDSLATGTPVVVTNSGWTKRFVQTHDCGWYVPPETPTALVNRLRTVLADPPLLNTAGQNARTAARQYFDRAEIMNRYAKLIQQVGKTTDLSA